MKIAAVLMAAGASSRFGECKLIKEFASRPMFEYALDASMLLKQDKNGKRILFDHLAPTDPKYEGYFMFYGPDASCDALVLKKEEWWYEENLTN